MLTSKDMAEMNGLALVRYKLVHHDATPLTWRAGNSGTDLHALYDATLYPGDILRVSFGIALEIPEGLEGQVRPRSGLSSRGFVCAIGTIDSSYRGELGAVLFNISRADRWEIRKGDRIVQLVISPVVQPRWEAAVELSETDRGARGFGSSGLR
jgi:dUTP pyrophosphatase